MGELMHGNTPGTLLLEKLTLHTTHIHFITPCIYLLFETKILYNNCS